MTTIMAIHQGGSTYIASDSRLTEGSIIYEAKGKLHKVAEDFWVGWAGSLGIVNGVLNFSELLELDPLNYEASDYRRVWHFADSISEYLTGEEATLIVATPYSVYSIDYIKNEHDTEEGWYTEVAQFSDIAVAGTGSEAALGAWYALTESSDLSDADIYNSIIKSIEIASKVDSATGGKIQCIIIS